jgi:hypothetical protein
LVCCLCVFYTRGRVEIESNIHDIHCPSQPILSDFPESSPLTRSHVTADPECNDAARRPVIFQLIRKNVPPPTTTFRFVINVDTILMAENGGNLYLPDAKLRSYSSSCLRSSQYHLPWRIITPTYMLPTSRTVILLPQISPISTLFVMNLRCHLSWV